MRFTGVSGVHVNAAKERVGNRCGWKERIKKNVWKLLIFLVPGQKLKVTTVHCFVTILYKESAWGKRVRRMRWSSRESWLGSIVVDLLTLTTNRHDRRVECTWRVKWSHREAVRVCVCKGELSPISVYCWDKIINSADVSAVCRQTCPQSGCVPSKFDQSSFWQRNKWDNLPFLLQRLIALKKS